MTKETMTVHKALAEMKTIDNRIAGKVMLLKPAVANKATNTKIGGGSIEEYKEEQRAVFQSVQDLIKRRHAIKRAIVKSNAITTVEIGGVTYTVAEAIEMKNSGIEHDKELLKKVGGVYGNATKVCDVENHSTNERADDFVAKTLGGEKGNIDKDLFKTHRDQYIASNTWSVIQAIDCKKVMDELEKKINAFEIEVDAALSVSNATTNIEIEY